MRLKLTLAYDGTAFSGWQVQPDRPTVQGTMEGELERLYGEPVPVVGASRTDAGVHAAGQVCHLDPPSTIPIEALPRALNGALPADVRVLAAEPAGDGFHARHDARRKTYCYTIDPAPVASPFLCRYAWHRPRPLDVEAMRQAADLVVGPVDQRAFATRPEPGRAVRPIDLCRIDVGRTLRVTVAGRSFLRYAVRGLVGTLVEVGAGSLGIDDLRRALEDGDRGLAGRTAPPHGLCLMRVEYGSPGTAGSTLY